MGRFDAATIAFSFLIIGGLGILAFSSAPILSIILLFGAFFIVLYSWLEMTAEIRDNLVELNKRLAKKESNEEIEE
jgi:threonine/homoserine/homoserine lactone efflux protein